MKKLTSLSVVLITFMFLASYAESITDSLPKEFFENADMYSKLDMVENLTILEKVSDRDLQVASQKADSDMNEVKP
ncbi:MAG: hypothetical protein H7256_16130 [Bdellovibrio sp.]|nr:hypothetical protein [Bdellovibrio sp.]